MKKIRKSFFLLLFAICIEVSVGKVSAAERTNQKLAVPEYLHVYQNLGIYCK